MKLHKQKLLVAAMAAGAAALSGVAGAQNAIALNPDGLGEALVYPYYSARNGTTLLSVVNTTTQGKAVKVRFREAKNSNDVLDFNVFLSPYDVWTGAVNAKNGGAYLTTNDTSCTRPQKSGYWDDLGGGVYGVPFVPYAYDLTDGTTGTATQGVDRTMEGYVEIIEMASIPTGSALYTAIKHVNGVPPCGADVPDAYTGSNVAPPTGGLFGAATFISTSGGTSAGMSTAVGANAYNGFGRAGSIVSAADPSPNFADHNACRAVVGDSKTMYLLDFAAGGACSTTINKAQAFAATNMASNVYGEYSYIGDGAAVHGTDWVITMPGKHFFTNTNLNVHGVLLSTDTLPVAPFKNIWDKTKKQSCDDITLLSTSREEDRASGPLPGFSPRPPDAPGSALCYESNVISFATGAKSGTPSNVMGSSNALFFGPTQSRGTSGWLDLSFTSTGAVQFGNAGRLTASVVGSFVISAGSVPLQNGATATVVGLPVVGFASTNAKLSAGSATVPANNYNSSAPLSYKRTIQ